MEVYLLWFGQYRGIRHTGIVQFFGYHANYTRFAPQAVELLFCLQVDYLSGLGCNLRDETSMTWIRLAIGYCNTLHKT